MLSLGWVKQNGKKNMEMTMKIIETILVILSILGFIFTMILGGRHLKMRDMSYALGYFACSIINIIVFIRLLFQ